MANVKMWMAQCSSYAKKCSFFYGFYWYSHRNWFVKKSQEPLICMDCSITRNRSWKGEDRSWKGEKSLKKTSMKWFCWIEKSLEGFFGAMSTAEPFKGLPFCRDVKRANKSVNYNWPDGLFMYTKLVLNRFAASVTLSLSLSAVRAHVLPIPFSVYIATVNNLWPSIK